MSVVGLTEKSGFDLKPPASFSLNHLILDAAAVAAGMAQAIHYAQLLDVPFSFSSNGDGFVLRDATRSDGVLERNITLDEFPSPAALWDKYCTWKGWTPEVRQVAAFDYSPSKTPRYYQRNAINRSVEAIANGQNRVLLSSASTPSSCWLTTPRRSQTPRACGIN